MLGLFRPPCPIDLREKVWTELRMGWLVERFGWQQMRDAPVILPTQEFFPVIRDGSHAEGEQTFERVCHYLEVQQDQVRLEIASDDAASDDTGGSIRDDVTTVRVPESLLTDQESLIAAMARLVTLDRLWRSGNLTGQEIDASWLVELATVFFGMGVFGANAAVQHRHATNGTWNWWAVRRQGHLPARVYGYAMALFAFSRREHRPAWARTLGHDALDSFRRGGRYLKKATDCVFDCEANGLTRSAKSDTALESDLRHGSDSIRLAALWDILDRGPAASQLTDAVKECLRMKNPILRTEAARVIGAMGPSASSAAPNVIRAFSSRNSDVRRQCVLAVEQLELPQDMKGPHGETVYDELLCLLEDPDPLVVRAVAHTLRRYGQEAQEAAEHMIRHLCRALVACDYETSDFYFDVLEAITPDIERFLDEHMKATHPDLYPLAVETLEQSRAHRGQ
ncbi:MAG: hypothetical protein ISR77_38985 [Pirellulaceae bacterium]|nr:hypothetical protein [Pirellulaceae bacterium]